MIQEAFEEHASLHDEAARVLIPALRRAAELAETALAGGGKLLVFGNGGSAAQSQHLAAELVVRFIRNRRALPAVALSTDTSALTAGGNDFGFEHVFERQVEALAREGDCVVALSTSGSSPNVLRAVDRARERGCSIIGLTGHGGGDLAERVDVLLAVPSDTTARIQEYHQICIHVLAGWLEEKLG